MKKQTTKEWIELTLCDMVDEVLQLMKSGKSKEDILVKIKKYSAEIYNAQ
ncbi:MAG: hypothetical protein Q7S18_02260 [bacterium]|nr:hypothetical protein [bacterium]